MGLIMKPFLLAAATMLLVAPSAHAQDGFYYGVGLGLTEATTNSPVVSSYTAKANDVSLALTAGYRFAGSSDLSFGIEGNLDILGGKTMSGDNDACTGSSPSWCSVDTVLRLRGTLTTELANGSRLTSSRGAVMVRGVSENGPGNNLDTTGRGVSIGLGWEPSAGLPVRVDVNYDSIKSDNQKAYERDLDLVGLRVSYMF